MVVRRLRRSVLAGVVTLTASLGVAACGSSSSSGGSGSTSGGGSSSSSGGSKSTIKVAQISSLTGAIPMPGSNQGSTAYFNYINSQGGIDGHKVSFTVGDDQNSASTASQLAHKFVLQNGVVAMVGGMSMEDCETNAQFYEQNNVANVVGGTIADCFTAPTIQPVNAGPYIGHEVEWNYVFNVLHETNVCSIDQEDPTAMGPYKKMVEDFESANHVKFLETTYTNLPTASPVPEVVNAKQIGCKVVVLNTVAPNFVAFVKAAKSTGLDATFIDDGGGYQDSVATTLGSLGEPGALGPNDKGVFVGSELAPTTDTFAGMNLMNQTFKADGVTPTFFSEAGWLAALEFSDAMKQALDKGEAISTAKDVLHALQTMTPVNTGFAATDSYFGSGSTHAPNTGSDVLLIKGGKWTQAPDQNHGNWTVVQAVDVGATK